VAWPREDRKAKEILWFRARIIAEHLLIVILRPKRVLWKYSRKRKDEEGERIMVNGMDEEMESMLAGYTMTCHSK